VKFQILNPKGFQLNFNHPNAKDLLHAGYIYQLNFKPEQISAMDQITGIFGMDNYNKRK
jgi:hypothetical protein